MCVNMYSIYWNRHIKSRATSHFPYKKIVSTVVRKKLLKYKRSESK